MPITREQILTSLHTDWATFVERFQRLSPEAKAVYLQQQGYVRIADLLAHIIAWCEDALHAIPAILDDPGYASPEHDVDLFNARAVERSHNLDEPAVITVFMDLCQQWLQLVNSLPDAAFQNDKISDRLHIEIIGHYAEHYLA